MNNNLFILRCAIESAKAQQKPLYVAVVDATNAFPLTDCATLWLKLQRLGIGGPIFDWLWMVYACVEYYVRHAGLTTDLFGALIGLLTGDTSSPVLWNLFASDLDMPAHRDDVFLVQRRISILAQADDILLLSHSPSGFQLKLNSMNTWGRLNFILVNKIKTVAMVYGSPVPSPLPEFMVGDAVLTISKKEKYVRVVFSTDTCSIFDKHYKVKEKSAWYYGHSIWAIKDWTGDLLPRHAKQLYMAQVDCHLIHGCEVMPDATKSLLEPLVDVQVKFICKMLHVGSRSMLVPLHTETGITPLQTCRFVLVLNFLKYTLTLQDNHLVWAAIMNSIALHISGRKTWFTDVLQAACNLPFSLAYDLDPWSMTPDYIDTYSKNGLQMHGRLVTARSWQ